MKSLLCAVVLLFGAWAHAEKFKEEPPQQENVVVEFTVYLNTYACQFQNSQQTSYFCSSGEGAFQQVQLTLVKQDDHYWSGEVTLQENIENFTHKGRIRVSKMIVSNDQGPNYLFSIETEFGDANTSTQGSGAVLIRNPKDLNDVFIDNNRVDARIGQAPISYFPTLLIGAVYTDAKALSAKAQQKAQLKFAQSAK